MEDHEHRAPPLSRLDSPGATLELSRNLVVCCDGTGNQISTDPTNVLKLWWMLPEDSDRQISVYYPGVGTMGNPGTYTRAARIFTRALDAAIGHTLGANVGMAYRFLVRNYRPGDRIYLFGFSRGAYTARALAGMLHMLGLVRPGLEELTPYIWLLYSNEEGKPELDGRRFGLAERFRERFARPVEVHFIGVWDTVSSVGFLRNRRLPFTAASNLSVRHVRHAVSIDERRAAFRQNLWNRQDQAASTRGGVKEVWFSGVHADVGGGYAEADTGLSKIPLAWMCREAEALGLLVEPARRDLYLGRSGTGYARENSAAIQHEELRGFWTILEVWPRRTWNPALKRRIPRMNLGSLRWIEPRATVHSSVVERYRLSNVPKRPDLHVAEHPVEY